MGSWRVDGGRPVHWRAFQGGAGACQLPHLGGIAKAGVEQAAQRVVSVHGQLLGDEAEALGQGAQREHTEDKRGTIAPARGFADDGKRKRCQQDVELGVQEELRPAQEQPGSCGGHLLVALKPARAWPTHGPCAQSLPGPLTAFTSATTCCCSVRGAPGACKFAGHQKLQPVSFWAPRHHRQHLELSSKLRASVAGGLTSLPTGPRSSCILSSCSCGGGPCFWLYTLVRPCSQSGWPCDRAARLPCDARARLLPGRPSRPPGLLGITPGAT